MMLKSKTFIIFVAIFVFLHVFCQNTMAADDVVLKGKARGLVLIPEGARLFSLTNMNPGDTEKREVTIKNSYKDSMTLYMKAQPLKQSGEPNLLSQLQLTLMYNDKVIYKGSVSGKAGEGGSLEDYIKVGSLSSGESGILTAAVTLPGKETDNRFQGAEAEVKWIFTAEIFDDDHAGGGNEREDDDASSPEEPPSEDIEDELISGGEPKEPAEPVTEPEEIEIIDEKIPKGAPQMPDTGEKLPFTYYAIGAFSILAGLKLLRDKNNS